MSGQVVVVDDLFSSLNLHKAESTAPEPKRSQTHGVAGVAFESETFHSTPSRSQGTNFSNT